MRMEAWQTEATGPPAQAYRISPVWLQSTEAEYKSPVYLDFHRFCELADDLSQAEELQLQGSGDPLLHLHFFEMVRHVAQRGLRVSTTTRLLVLPEYRAAECVDSGLHAMHIALDAANPARYRTLYGRDCYAKVLRNMRRLIAARTGAGSRNPSLQLACVASRANLAQLPDLVQLASDEGLDGIRIQTPEEGCGEQRRLRPGYFQTMREVPGPERLAHEDIQRIAFYFGRAESRARGLGLALRLPPQYNLSQLSS